MGTQEQKQTFIAADEAKTIAREAWLFGMPLVCIEIQFDTGSHVSKLKKGKAPVNQFAHYREVPDASKCDRITPPWYSDGQRMP